MPRGRKPETKTTPKKDWKAVFLDQLAKCGCVQHSCDKARINKNTAYRHRNSNKKFAAEWDDAVIRSRDVMELEARRRAIEGTLKPVYQGGDHVGDIREYSDTLLIFLMKGADPGKYRERIDHQHTGSDGGPITTEFVVKIINDSPNRDTAAPQAG